MQRSPACLAFGLAALLPLVASAGVLDDIRARGEVRLGYRADAPPLSYASADGKQGMGFAVDLCKAVIKDLDRYQHLLGEIRGAQNIDLAMLSVLLRELRGMT